MRILIAGGTGFTGSYISERFLQKGYQVSFVSRNEGHIGWNESELTNALNTTDVLINLSGKNINCRQTHNNKQAILQSRISTTTMLGTAISKCKTPPTLWINASASAIYESSNDVISTETNYREGTNFLANVVRQWENAFFGFKLASTRQVALRTSVVLGTTGGAFPPLNLLARIGLGGKSGNGKQQFSWIHIDDFYRIIEFIIDNSLVNGVVNATSPSPLPNADFMRKLREINGCRIGIPTPAFALKLAEKIVDLNASLVLEPVNIYPEILLNSDFKFHYPDIETAIKNLTNK
jgi:uncharacterized protein (TIGR01777 family)